MNICRGSDGAAEAEAWLRGYEAGRQAQPEPEGGEESISLVRRADLLLDDLEHLVEPEMESCGWEWGKDAHDRRPHELILAALAAARRSGARAERERVADYLNAEANFDSAAEEFSGLHLYARKVSRDGGSFPVTIRALLRRAAKMILTPPREEPRT